MYWSCNFLYRLPGPQSLKTIKKWKRVEELRVLNENSKQFISRQIIQSITKTKHVTSILQNWKTRSRGETKGKLKMMPYLRNNEFMNNASLSIMNGDLMRWNRRRTVVSPGGDVDGCLEFSWCRFSATFQGVGRATVPICWEECTEGFRLQINGAKGGGGKKNVHW